ncbi:hypothetical protein E2C01_053844 [Portunus trituberculatus]|uniref:Uncharacterized protein n=1 Tax=Portunus trituberculatus TaxID=210409 RepID=A0A5B7GQG2_PORTR|nr:hypothetical protein [Portunus trituberculatus]
MASFHQDSNSGHQDHQLWAQFSILFPPNHLSMFILNIDSCSLMISCCVLLPLQAWLAWLFTITSFSVTWKTPGSVVVAEPRSSLTSGVIRDVIMRENISARPWVYQQKHLDSNTSCITIYIWVTHADSHWITFNSEEARFTWLMCPDNALIV